VETNGLSRAECLSLQRAGQLACHASNGPEDSVCRYRPARKNSDGKGHIYRSTDAGETWRLLDGIAKWANDAVIHRLAIRRDDPNVLFAATDKGLFKSTDGGVTFERKETGLPHRFCRNVIISPSRPDVMYVVMWSTHAKEPWHGGVYRSDDGGETWVARNTELPQMVAPETRAPQCTCNYARFLIDPRDPDRIFVGANSWWGAGLYRSTNGGRHWDKITYMRDDKKNMDLGWITFTGIGVKCIACAPSNPDVIFYGTSMRLMKSVDGGDHWRQCYTAQRPDGTWQTNGAATTCVSRIAVDPHDSRRIYAGYADIGLMVSENGGESWARSENGLKRHGDLAEVVIDPADTNVLWCKDGKWQGTCHVAQSHDRGKTWKTISGPQSGLPDSVLFNLLLDPSSPEAVGRYLRRAWHHDPGRVPGAVQLSQPSIHAGGMGRVPPQRTFGHGRLDGSPVEPSGSGYVGAIE
jgi:photosystem II stability/assembly factor-like uncharacterized protein